MTPTDIDVKIINCIVSAYADQDPEVFKQPEIISGGSEVANGLDCCDGGYIAVSFIDVSLNTRESEVNTKGRLCYAVYDWEIQVHLVRCINSFNVSGGNTSGMSVDFQSRQNASFAMLDEGWFLFQALSCCSMSLESWQGSRVKSQEQRVYGDCIHQIIKLEWETKVCCN